MPEILLDRVIGPDFVVQIDLGLGLVGLAGYQNLNFAFSANEVNADAADTRITEGVLPKKRLTVTGSMWVNVDNDPNDADGVRTALVPFDKIIDIEALVGGASGVPDLTDYLPLTVTDATYNIEVGPEACNFTAVSGILNPA